MGTFHQKGRGTRRGGRKILVISIEQPLGLTGQGLAWLFERERSILSLTFIKPAGL